MPSLKSRKTRAGTRKARKSPGKGAENSRGGPMSGVELAEIKRLIRLVLETGIGELEVSGGGRTVRISARPEGAALSAQTAGPAERASAAAETPAPPAAPDTTVAITSPMVGTFYRAPAPDADPYVEVGDRVEMGQTVCIVEAMKLMNEIEADTRGRIVQILVENAQPVEFGQKLFLVQPE